MSLSYETSNPCLIVECPICLDPLISEEYISFDNCNHKYHIKCLNEWTTASCPELLYHYKCPTCRRFREINIEGSIIGNREQDVPVIRRSLLHNIRQCIINLVSNN